jgi:hypothetical protein
LITRSFEFCRTLGVSTRENIPIELWQMRCASLLEEDAFAHRAPQNRTSASGLERLVDRLIERQVFVDEQIDKLAQMVI